MKIRDILYNFYGDFDFIEEKYNEKYELAKKHRKKKDILPFSEKKTKTRITRMFLIPMKILRLS